MDSTFKEQTPKEKTPFVKILLIIGLIILLALVAVQISGVIMIVFGAILAAVFLHGLANILRRYVPLSESLSVLLVAVLLIAALSLGIWLLAPSVAEQAAMLRARLPQAVQNVEIFLSRYGWGQAVLGQIPDSEQMLAKIENSNFLSDFGSVFSSTAGAVVNLVLMLLLAIYLAIEPQTYVSGLIELVPQKNRRRAGEILSKIGVTLSRWLIGKGALMLSIGLMIWLGTWLLGVPLALLLGLIAGICSFVPNFGPILSGTPAVLLAFLNSPSSALYVLIMFVAVRLAESNLITPLIERRTVKLPPALTIAWQLAATVLLGAAGLILATPILATVIVLVRTIYIQDVLGDETESLPEAKARKSDAAAQDSVAGKSAAS